MKLKTRIVGTLASLAAAIGIGGSALAHVIDIMPTILDAAGVRLPDTLNGIKQNAIEGVSMAYTWDKANASAPSTRTTQYFEMLGNRALYHDGWVAATTPASPPWVLSGGPAPDVITGYKWELYELRSDFTQADDLAAKIPAKLKEMQDLFYAEIKKFRVLPLDNSTLPRLLTARPSTTAGRSVFTYSGVHSGIPSGSAPNILQRSFKITAEVTIPEGGAEGMIVTEGGRFGGYGLYLSKGELGVGRGKPVYLYNLFDLQRTAWAGPELKAGRHTLEFDFRFDGGGFAKGGLGTLHVDGRQVDQKRIKHTVPFIFQWDETFDVVMDTGTPVAFLEYRYDMPFHFTGTLNKLSFDQNVPLA